MFGVDNGKVAISDGTNIYRGTTSINDGEWYRLVFVCGETKVHAYVEGVEEIVESVGSEIINASKINAVGHAYNTSVHPISLDGIQIYDNYLFPFHVYDYIDNTYSPADIEPVFDRPNDDINNISGLIARYTPESFNASTGVWEDIVGSYDATTTRGTVGTKTTAEGGYTVLYGGTGDGMRFPTGILPSTYTLVHVSRYSGGTESRIFQGTNGNWLSGYWQGNAGVAYHGSWLTAQTDYNGTNWRIYTDQNSYFRDSGIVRATSGGGTSVALGLNDGSYAEFSDWEVAEVLVFNRHITTSEMSTIEDILGLYYPNAGITSTLLGSGDPRATNLSSSLVATFIGNTEFITTTTTANVAPIYIDSDFPVISLHTLRTHGRYEANLTNTTITSNNFMTVYKPQYESNEEDQLKNRTRVVKSYSIDRLKREKWS